MYKKLKALNTLDVLVHHISASASALLLRFDYGAIFVSWEPLPSNLSLENWRDINLREWMRLCVEDDFV